MTNTALSYKQDGYEFKVVDHKLSYYKDNAAYEIPEGGNLGTETTYKYVTKDDVLNGEYNFRLYITNEVDVDKNNKRLTDMVNAIAKNTKYVVGTTTAWDESYAEAGKTPYTPSYAVLSPENIYVVLMKKGEATVATTSLSGADWTYTENCDLLARLFKDVDITKIATDKSVANTAWTRWVEIFDETYHHQRNKSTLTQSLLYLGIYTVLVFFLGLMVFLLTRGKNNPFRYIKFFVAQKIAWWAAFTPGLLAMILGFIFGTSNVIGQMAFIMLISLRVMWASMRQLRPVY